MIDIRKYNSAAWDKAVERQSEWTIPVDADVIAAARQGQWLKKHPMVIATLECDLDPREMQKLKNAMGEIDKLMGDCKAILGLDEVE